EERPVSTVSVPPHLERALRRGLSVDPADRFASMDMLLHELSRRPGQTRRRALLGVGAVGGALALGLGLGRSATTSETTADPCASVGSGVAQAWEGSRAEALGARLAESGLN